MPKEYKHFGKPLLQCLLSGITVLNCLEQIQAFGRGDQLGPLLIASDEAILYIT
jgi:hypothetical protein